MRYQLRSIFGRLILVLIGSALTAGCTGAPKSTVVEQFYETPGRYPAAPLGATKPRVGMPAPAVEVINGAAPDDHVGEDAAEQLFWVADQAGRFNLIERLRLAEIISRQGLDGTLVPGKLVHPAALVGVDYVLICRISGLSIHGAEKPTAMSVANVEKLLHVSAPTPTVITTATLELHLVDPATGSAPANVEDHFSRTCSPEAMGLSFASPEAAWGQLHLNDEQVNQVLRIVLDDAMRKFLPQLDTLLTHPLPPTVARRPSSTAAASTSPARAKSAIAKIRCPECGFECSIDDEFCPNCGARLLQNGVRLQPSPK